MTTNARDEKWSSWIDWSGDSMPVEPECDVEVEMRWYSDAIGKIRRGQAKTFQWDLGADPQAEDVIAYRYKIKEPETTFMHEDLCWLARNVSEWKTGYDYLAKRLDSDGCLFETVRNANYEQHNDFYGKRFNEAQWLQARKDLGLIMSDSEEELPAEEWGGKIGGPRKAEAFLNQAAELLAERGKQYDQPGGERSMGKAVAALNAITGRDLTEAEGWLLFSLVKRVRQYSGQGYHKDSAEDGVTYGALEAEALESAG